MNPSLCGLQLLEIGQHFFAVTLRINLEVHFSDHARGIDQEGVARGKSHAVVFHDRAVLLHDRMVRIGEQLEVQAFFGAETLMRAINTLTNQG